jgi:SpoVK/Ycf46/Vps4 family AAA+-type ATPase
VPTNDDTNLEIGKRLGKVKTAELLLKQTRGVLVVDEAEDIFSNTTHSSFLIHNPENHSKHLLNEFLETSQTPIIWIVNNRGMIDPAFRRRCDAVIKIDKLPAKARRKIIQKHTHGLTVPASWKDELAKNQSLTPADIGSAARVARLAGHKKQKAVQTMERALSSRLEEREGKQLQKSSGPRAKLPYRMDWLNTDADMNLVLEQLSAGADARFCFYGSPGTGKTAFARHAAEQAGLPLVEKRASDLLSKWVGESEQNIAGAFQEAKSEGAILLIDEVDSFLQSRSGANHSWEVSMVNELLTQMEGFGGTLICCTNFMDGVDEAAFRRFDVKIQFQPLTYEQAAGMLSGMGVKVDEMAAHQLKKIPLLTPGDFAAVQRRFQFLSKEPTAQAILAELQREVAHKKGGRKKIGF